MQAYKNELGNSGVTGYEIGDEEIIVRFVDGSVYLYNYTNPGKFSVDHMKDLATNGHGLTTFINQHVRNDYARKLK